MSKPTCPNCKGTDLLFPNGDQRIGVAACQKCQQIIRFSETCTEETLARFQGYATQIDELANRTKQTGTKANAALLTVGEPPTKMRS